jgi:hypothetical protein
MITIRETIVSTRLLEPTFVRYRRLASPHVKRFEPIYNEIIKRPLRPQVAALYGTNRSPRDRMRHDYRWRERRNPTGRYTAIDPRWR